MITIVVDPTILAAVLSIIVLAISGSWFWARNHSTLSHHWADPFYGAPAVVAVLALIVCVAIILVAGVSSLS